MLAKIAPIPDPSPGGQRLAALLRLALALWTALVLAYLAYSYYSRSSILREADEANVREWLDESRVFRKALPELVGEYVEFRDVYGQESDLSLLKRQEIAEQLKRLADPTRIYQGQIPLFPDVYRLEVSFPGTPWEPISWVSPMPRPRPQLKSIFKLNYAILGASEPRARLQCDYRLHAYNAQQREAEEAQRLLATIGLVIAAGLPMVGWVYIARQRERTRELARLQAEKKAEQAENQAYREQLARQDAERATLEIKSQIFASIGIMAGSYAHNIKNLLVRPNDLIARCLESDGLSPKQQTMLGEVRATFGTVTERLQQILKSVRRDPTRSEAVRLELNGMVRGLLANWEELARDKWKLAMTAELCAGDLVIDGDDSHLIQALENLLFNARDATYEMRNHLRDQAHADRGLDPATRQKALLEAASWRGQIRLRTSRADGASVLEVTDNGIGMTEEVRRRCIETHFSTKRDNALFEGLEAGKGLGLSFVVMVLEHHGATLEIESAPFHGATFRVRFPAAATATS